MSRSAVILVLAGVILARAAAFGVAEDLPSRYGVVAIQPSKTSIYIGSVTMTMQPFVRKRATYFSRYYAKVFPYFFASERGRIAIDVSDEELRHLAGGVPIDFTGLGVSDEGDQRPIVGRATPTGATTGKIKVRVYITKRTALTFNTTYQLKSTVSPSETR